VAGLGGAKRNACVALWAGNTVLGVCEQERITRVKAAGFNATGLPDEVLDELLLRTGRTRRDVTHYAHADRISDQAKNDAVSLDHHLAHACSAFLPSPFQSALVVVCDRSAPHTSVWKGRDGTLTKMDWPWSGPGLADVYSASAAAIGFTDRNAEQRMEALARLDPSRRDCLAEELISLEPSELRVPPDWQARIEGSVSGHEESRSRMAASLQSRIGDLLVDFLACVARREPAERRLCLGGSLFHNSYLNSRARLSGQFDEVFVPLNPGDAGLSVGAAMHVSGGVRQVVTPFLGPSYTSEETKAILDNCKLAYDWVSDEDAISIAVKELRRGRLVGWLEGAMEWGPRALGGRSILANPFSEYVLDNLNRFLKLREHWRGYSLSGLEPAVREHFEGPAASPFMDSDYTPRDRTRFRHVLVTPSAAVRVQTVGSDAPPRFRGLLERFGHEAGIPVLVNTSFNGFQEPIVCNPRDALRVFFGSGVDTLILGSFVIRK
jgi:carbamoyltransferase